MNEVFIPGNIPSLKNSKIYGRFPSKGVQKWLRLFGISQYNSKRKEVKMFKRINKMYDFEEIFQQFKIKEYPVLLGFHFIRGTKHSWDFNNANHIITDLMTAFDIIPDDSTKYVLPFPLEIDGNYYSYDKENPGVIIRILN